MERFIISPESIIDIITNSSSEIFVCNTDKSIKVVREILEELLNMYNKHHDADYTFNDTFAEPYIITKDTYDEYDEKFGEEGQIVIESRWDNSIPYELYEYIETTFSARRYHR